MRPRDVHYFILPATGSAKRAEAVAELPPHVRRRLEAGFYLGAPLPDGTVGYVPRDLWLQAACWTAKLESSGDGATPGPVAVITGRLVRTALAAMPFGAAAVNNLSGRFMAIGDARAARCGLAAMLASEIEGEEDRPDTRAAVMALAGLTYLDDNCQATRSEVFLRAIGTFGTPRQHLEELAAEGPLATDLREILEAVRDRVIDEAALARAMTKAAQPAANVAVAPEPARNEAKAPSAPALPPERPPKAARARRPALDLASLPDVLSAEEAMAVLAVGRSTLYEWAKKGRLPAIRYGRTLRFEKVALLAWRDAQAKAIAPEEPVGFNWKRLRRRP